MKLKTCLKYQMVSGTIIQRGIAVQLLSWNLQNFLYMMCPLSFLNHTEFKFLHDIYFQTETVHRIN